MDNPGLDKHDLPETSEILAPFGSIAFEGSLRSHKNTLTVDDGTVRSTRPVCRGSSEALQRTSSRPGVGGVFQDNETGYRRKESVVYAQKGKAEVTFINIQLDKTNDQGTGKAKRTKVSPATDASQPKTGIQHHKHITAGERDAHSLKECQNVSQTESPSIHTTGGKDTSDVKPGAFNVSDGANSRTLFSGSSSGLVLDPGKLDSDPPRPLREEVSYVRNPTTTRVVGVRRLSEGSTPSCPPIGDPGTTHQVNISTIRQSDGSSQPAPIPGRDNKSPPGRIKNVDGVFDEGNTETSQTYRPGTSVRGTDILGQKARKITEAGIMYLRTEPDFLVSRDTKYIDVSSPASSSERIAISRTAYMMNTDLSSSQLAERKYNTTSSGESSETVLKRHITDPGFALNASIIHNADSPISASTDSALKINTTSRPINVAKSDTLQDVNSSAVSGPVPDVTSNAQNTSSTSQASQRNSVASGCSYVSSVVDAQARLDLERCSPTHFHTKWRLYNTEISGTDDLKEDCSVQIRPDILHVKDNRTLTSATKDSKELHTLNTDETTHNKGSLDSGTGDYILSPGSQVLSDQYHGTPTAKGFSGTPNDTRNKHDPNTVNDRAAKLVGKDKSYFPDGKGRGTKSRQREQMQPPHMIDRPHPQASSKTQIHNYEDGMTGHNRDLITSKARVNKQSSDMVEIHRPGRDQLIHTADYEKGSTGDLTKGSNYKVDYSSPTDGTHMVQRDCVHVLNETEDSSGSGDQGRRRKEGRIEHYKDKLCPGRVVKVEQSAMSQTPDSGENNPEFPTEKGNTFNRSFTDTRVISGKAGKRDRAEDDMGGVEETEARLDTQITHRHPKEHRKHHDKSEYPTQSMRDTLLAGKGYAGVIAPGVVAYNDNRPERSNVVGDNEIHRHQSVMDRVKSWVVSHDASESTASRAPSRDSTDSPRPFDRHSIAEMPLKVLETAVPIDQEDVCPDEVFEDGTHGIQDPSGSDSRYLEPREVLPVDEHLHVHHDVHLIREDPEGSEGLARRRFDSLSTDPRTVYSRSLSDGFRKIEESKSEQVSIEMADLGNGSDVAVARHQSEGAIFNTSLLDGWEPSSPYAHRVKRNSSTLSEGAQPISAGKSKVRQLSLAIGEEWEDMTGTHPVTSPDGTGSVAVSQRSLRRERSQQRSWSGCSTSSAPMFLGRTIRYMSHPARLENYLRRNTIPEGNEPTTIPPPSATTTAETMDVEEKNAQLRTTDDEKRWLTPNPYNRINQKFHSTLQCPCYLFFCFLCCLPAVYYMQISDKEYDYGCKEKSRVYGRRATVLYVIGAISATIFLSTVTSLVVIFMQEYLTRQQT